MCMVRVRGEGGGEHLHARGGCSSGPALQQHGVPPAHNTRDAAGVRTMGPRHTAATSSSIRKPMLMHLTP